MENKDIINKLKKLPRFDLQSWSCEGDSGIDKELYEEGEWIKWEDIELLINDLLRRK
jgi:hypothetical protein